ncbi:hypothetical protein L6452_06060 [Arctium lappa]|uniref:Uncharacterized protein n=1 Tax=Arctium lappa TaxID=4217 RepID=A0ACB9EIE8_ARCLA|nr:hypothetical protein L6452_06060 [Arctium lappa]
MMVRFSSGASNDGIEGQNVMAGVAPEDVGFIQEALGLAFKGDFEKGTCFAHADDIILLMARGIVPFCKGLDVIQQAQSGTGKTATFCSGILQQLDYNVVECQALVLAPTCELAQQIEKVMRALGDYIGVKVHACVGGRAVTWR